MSKQAEILKETPYYYSIIDCLKEHSQKGINIKKIIDINFSQMYYNFNKLKKYYKNELFGIEFLKIPLVPKEIPSRKELNRIYDILNKNISKKEYILIHCTNGVNRTGYVLVYFLCKRYEYTVDKAVALFEKCRGHRFTNKAFVEDLRQKFKDNK